MIRPSLALIQSKRGRASISFWTGSKATGWRVRWMAWPLISLTGGTSDGSTSIPEESPLGVAAVAGRFKDAQAGGIEAVLMNTEPTPIQRKLLQPVRKDIQLLVADVVMTAKWKDGRDWRRDAVQDTSRFRKRIGRLNPENMAPLLVFVGGGRANSKWYQDAILSTHADFGHLNLNPAVSRGCYRLRIGHSQAHDPRYAPPSASPSG